MASWEELERKCSRAGGELSPIPCSYYNSYCDTGECIYSRTPIFVTEDDDGFPAYCCRRVS